MCSIKREGIVSVLFLFLVFSFALEGCDGLGKLVALCFPLFDERRELTIINRSTTQRLIELQIDQENKRKHNATNATRSRAAESMIEYSY
ncbi:hypothetical protein VTL71DRAFT_15816 [Oculimacula yallundae]|uniref:Secreted protein n=1 Tax=Oculimacula yallundae TaxID=86028 RepID=A0ABR4CD91_9HELO